MRKWLLAGTIVGAGLVGLPAFSQTATPAACPEGQARGPDGGCSVTMPATPHQLELLKPGAGPTSPAAGAATTGTPTAPAGAATGGSMPATPHQQDVLKPKSGG